MATPQAIFTDLCARFELSDAVRDQIVSMGISSLSEFRYYVTTAAELEALFITPIRDLDNRRLQLARLRHCWSGLCADYQRGRCSRQREKQCSAGEHRCAVQFSTDRVCGSPKHIGSRCPDARRSR